MDIRDTIDAACSCYGISLVFMSNEFMNKVLEMLGKIYISFWFGGGVSGVASLFLLAS